MMTDKKIPPWLPALPEEKKVKRWKFWAPEYILTEAHGEEKEEMNIPISSPLIKWPELQDRTRRVSPPDRKRPMHAVLSGPWSADTKNTCLPTERWLRLSPKVLVNCRQVLRTHKFHLGNWKKKLSLGTEWSQTTWEMQKYPRHKLSCIFSH